MEKNQNQGKEIWLHPEELERMILGSLRWTNVVERLGREPEKVPEVVISGKVRQKPGVPSSEVNNRIISNRSSNRPVIKLEGLKVVFLLVGVALLTMATWAYFFIHGFI